MKTNLLTRFCIIALMLLSFADIKAQILSVCNCSNTGDYNCTYIVKVNIEACNVNNQCIALVPITNTISPGTCASYFFHPPFGYHLVYGSATFFVTNTSNTATANFGTVTTVAPGNCFNPCGNCDAVTKWNVNGNLTSYTVCPDIIVAREANPAGLGPKKELTVNELSPEKKTLAGVSCIIYPNPSFSETNLSIKSDMPQTIKVEVYNSYNSKVHSLNKELIQGDNTVKIEGLDKGMYFVILSTENGPITQRFSVQK